MGFEGFDLRVLGQVEDSHLELELRLKHSEGSNGSWLWGVGFSYRV